MCRCLHQADTICRVSLLDILSKISVSSNTSSKETFSLDMQTSAALERRATKTLISSFFSCLIFWRLTLWTSRSGGRGAEPADLEVEALNLMIMRLGGAIGTT